MSQQNAFPPLHVIGLMSGTSVDSIDAACVRIQLSLDPVQLIECQVLGTRTQDMPLPLRQQLLEVMAQKQIGLEALCLLNVEIGACFAETALGLIQDMKQAGHPVDLIASHGQTLFHVPPQASGSNVSRYGATLQIGEPSVIAEVCQTEVIADFRPGDMAAGGQGAPLVPFADQLLFQDQSIARAVQNIGGIANLTALSARDDTHHQPMAFDTGPGNMMIDAAMALLYGQDFDQNGEIAQSGQVSNDLLSELLAHPYFESPPPKSTGRELFGAPLVNRILEQWEQKLSAMDIIATLTELTAQSIVQAYERFVLPTIPVQEVIVGGGGVYNQTLMVRLTQLFRPLRITLKRHEDYGVPSKYKEAIAFALLGYARKFGLPNNLPSCTGATHPISLGALWQPESSLIH